MGARKLAHALRALTTTHLAAVGSCLLRSPLTRGRDAQLFRLLQRRVALARDALHVRLEGDHLRLHHVAVNLKVLELALRAHEAMF